MEQTNQNEEIIEVEEKDITIDASENKDNSKKKFTIMGISIWRLFAYFIIYSFIGYLVETVFGIATKGVWESRQSFLYGPFCAVYGLGAVIMIVFLHPLGKKYTPLFAGGFILGSVTEYLVSLIGELLFGLKWWDYSNMPLNIGGRICVYFSFFWGFLAVYLMVSVNPQIDKLIDWVKKKVSLKRLKVITLTTIILLFLDWVISGYAVNLFLTRMIVDYDIDVENKEYIVEYHKKIEANKPLSDFIDKYWSNKKMIRTFPNLRLEGKNGDIIYMDSFLDIQPYYLKINEKNNS